MIVIPPETAISVSVVASCISSTVGLGVVERHLERRNCVDDLRRDTGVLCGKVLQVRGQEAVVEFDGG